jgi:deoxycytidylate deaminase
MHFDCTAIIYDKKGNILSIGKNSYVKTHPIQAHYAHLAQQPHRIFLHAEIDAIIKCRNIDKAHRMLITRIGNSGRYLPSYPCKVCQQAIKAVNIPQLEYTT